MPGSFFEVNALFENNRAGFSNVGSWIVNTESQNTAFGYFESFVVGNYIG